LMTLALGWAIMMPILMRFAEHFNGYVLLKEAAR
jgi:hypothetical protein